MNEKCGFKRGLQFHHFVLISIIGWILSISCTDKESIALISDIQEEAARYGEQAKMHAIRAAAHVYALEYGESPKTLEELVDKGYISASDILDHKGEKLPFSGETILPNRGVTKSCGSCGLTVSPDSKAGDRCPYCGVKWGTEKRMYKD